MFDPFFIGTSPIILAGDFNMVENLTIDKENGNPNRGNEGLTELKSIKDSYDLNDPFRHLYKTERSYTWSCENSGVKTRLDRYYVSKGLNKNLIAVSNIHCNVSDHLGVKAEFNEVPNVKFKIKKGLWKFNTNLLKDPQFQNEIEQQWYSLNNLYSEKNWELWEEAKLKFQETALKFSKNNEKNYRKLLKELEDGILELDALISNSSDDSFKDAAKEEKKTF